MRLKKILSLLLAMTMLFSCVGLTAMAEETISENVAEIEDTEYATLEDALNAAKEGDTINLKAGEHELVNDSFSEGRYWLPENLTIIGEDGAVVTNGPAISAKSITIDNVDFINPVNSGYNSGLVFHLSGDSAIKNSEIDGYWGGSYYSTASGNLLIEKCDVYGAVYGLHIAEGSAVVDVVDSKISGWNTYGSEISATFDNCEFAGNGSYAFLGFYNDVTIKNCSFTPDMKIASQTGKEIDITLNKCTVTDGTSIVNLIDASSITTSNITVDGVSLNSPTPEETPVAQIGDTPYATLEEAFAAAKNGDEILLLADVEGDITIPADVIFNGNGFAVSGGIIADGNITFAGITKAKDFDVSYIGTTINIGSGATLELTGTDRMVIGHGCTFNIEGNVTDAKTANAADLTPSLIAPGASFTGAGVNFNVTNAYVKFTAYCSSKNSNANNTFNINVTNSIWEQNNTLVFSAPTNGMDPTFNFNVKDSVLNSTSHLVFAVTKGDIVFDNSNVNVGTSRQIENQSTMTIKNGSVVYASVQVSSNANNPGTLIVDNATYIATGEFSGVNLGTGKLILKNGATATVPKFGNATVEIGAGCTLNTNYKTDGEFTITAESGYEVKFDNGVYTTVKGPVAKIGDKYYTSFESAVADIKQDGSDTIIEILTDIETSESIKFKYGTGDVIFTADHPVTVKQTSLKTDWDMVDAKDTKFVIDENVTFEIYDNTSGMYLYYGPSIEIKGSVIGGQNWGTLYLFNGDHKVTETGKIGVGRIQTAYNTLEVKGEIDTNYLLVENATFVSDGAKIDAGVIYDNNNGGQRWGASKFVIKNSSKVTTDKLTLSYADTELAIDASSSLAATEIVGAGKIIIDATGMTAGDVSTISGNASGFTGTIEVINNDSLEAKIEDGKIVLVAKPVAYIGEIGYESVQAAINAAQNGETVTISAGEYGAINISNKNITIQGTVGDNGEILTTIKGGNPAITGHSFNGTIRDIKIVDAFKAMYAEPAGNVTVDNVYVTGATYGFHLVAYTTGLTWKIENSYMDLAWANSFGVYGNGDADIIIRGNEFVSTNPYYPDYGALHVNSFSPNVTIEENIFRKNARIYIDKSVTDTSKVKVSKNYHADGVENAFADDADGVMVKIDSYYTGVDENGDLTGLVELPKGSNSYAYTGEVDGYVRVWGEGGGNAKESFVLKLYSEDTLMATTQLNNIGGIIDGDVYVTWNFFYPKSNDAYWTTTWEAGHPNKLAKPTKVELYIDGTLVSTTDAQMNGADGINPVVWEELGGVMAPELPTATVTELEKEDLTFALNFKADDASEAQLAYYGNWFADYVLTVNKDVTFNANGGADGYLSGQYKAYSENWVNVPFEDVTLKAGESIRIMEYAAKLLNQPGLKLTYNDVYGFVKDFNCGVFFEEEFLAKNPDFKVTLELRMYNPKDESESYVIGETYTFEAPEVETSVAAIGEKNFTTLEDAIIAANAGDTITLLENIALESTVTVPAGKEIVLDLAGKTISQTKEQTAGYQMILNDGSLTIKDSVGGGKISYTDSGNGGEYISDTIYNRGTLVVNGGTIENLSSSTVAANGYPHAIDNYSGIRNTSVTINDGTVCCAEYSAIRMFCVSATNTADLTINGGTIKGAVDMQNGTAKAAKGSLKVTGGIFETTKNANNIRFANWNGGAAEYGITASIEGGTFNGGLTKAYVPAAANWNSKVVSGGTFDVKPKDGFAAEGYEFTANEDGKYEVTEKEEVELFDFYGSNIILGNSLAMNFAVETKHFDGTDYIAVIEHYTEKGVESLEIPFSEWVVDGSYYKITYSNVTAKQIVDRIDITIYDGKGNQVSENRVDGIKAYAERMLGKSTSSAELKTVLVDMLNYGAAAQLDFNYKTSELANADLTDEQKAYASEMPVITNESERDSSKCVGSNLILEDNIKMNMAFVGITEDMYVEYEYTNHYETKVSKRVDYKDLTPNSNIYHVLTINDFVIADANQIVTATVRYANGDVYTVCKDSMNSYLARQLDSVGERPSGLYSAIAKFTASSYNYLH